MTEMTDKDKVSLSRIAIDGEDFFKISNVDQLRPFLMSIVSDSNHWMFVSSNGGLSAGRKDAENALFPYYTDDKITESADITGSKSIFLIHKKTSTLIWEPFKLNCNAQYNVSRNLYKSIYGNKAMFEEINHDLALIFQYSWNTSNDFGFVKKSKLINLSHVALELTVLDGIQNILPHGVNSDVQNRTSNLVDAYKRNELLPEQGLGIYSLSAIIVDKAEPSEALKATIAWSTGLKPKSHLLSSLQIKDFKKGISIQQEKDIKAEKGAYFVISDITLSSQATEDWKIISDINIDHSALIDIKQKIENNDQLSQWIENDIDKGTKRLIALNASSDGLQLTSDDLRDSRHFSNTLFNIMRGGIFDFNYQIEKNDLKEYIKNANKKLYQNFKDKLDILPSAFTVNELKEYLREENDVHFSRLCLEYLPLRFSRRHGDPSRPWNKFSINTNSELDGSKILDYEGNWRDIFQNWEALALSYPLFIEGMILKFLNATTFDGYNPYRITKDGFDWEIIEDDDPWSYIGYWGDHQIIYLLKFLEFSENHFPKNLESYFDKEIFVYANVPYEIKEYQDILDNPKDTIAFNSSLDKKIRKNKERYGTDASLLTLEDGTIYTVNFMEKILATLLAKLSNFIPDGGIWMNTQRPEWNDANNALVGNGVSVVTLCYLRRFLSFFNNLLVNHNHQKRFKVSNELIIFYKRVRTIFEESENLLHSDIDVKTRRTIIDQLGSAGSDYRHQIYNKSFWGEKRTVSVEGLIRFMNSTLKFIDHTLRSNKRLDNLYHSYNLLHIDKVKEASLSYLNEMLEGQVAILSSGLLSANESLAVLNALKDSALFREDQYSYLLYPNKDLKRFIDKNNIPKELVLKSELLTNMINNHDVRIIEQDIEGDYHFNGNFHNAKYLSNALDELQESDLAALIKKERKMILQIFEEVFNHKSFTGRSGTFFGYEGLGSIYWHMVSKLLLAVQECALKAIDEDEDAMLIGKLLEHYYEINEGIGVHKSPELYGAFPTDPYSHTPAGKGAQQPGMTGQVKEDILCRFGELGVFVKQGKILFKPHLLRAKEFLKYSKSFEYFDVEYEISKIELEQNSLAFTYCQVPIIYKKGLENSIDVVYANDQASHFNSLHLDIQTSAKIFNRTGEIKMILVYVNEDVLK